MSVEYAVVKNPLVEGTFIARAQTKDTITTPDLLDDIVTLTGLSRPIVEAVIKALFDSIAEELKRGNNVSLTNLMTFALSISAVLSSPTSNLPPDAVLNVTVRIAREFAERVRSDITFQRVEADNLAPVLLTVTAITGSLTALRDRDIVQIEGSRLYFDMAQNDVGVYLIGADGNDAHVMQYTEHGDKKITFIVPDSLSMLTDYTLEVRTRGRNSLPTSPLRVAAWPQKLKTA